MPKIDCMVVFFWRIFKIFFEEKKWRKCPSLKDFFHPQQILFQRFNNYFKK
jgi:hypothetical protein